MFHSRITLHKNAFRHIDHVVEVVAAVGGAVVVDLLGVVGGDEVVENDQEEQSDAHEVGEHGELDVGNHDEVF